MRPFFLISLVVLLCTATAAPQLGGLLGGLLGATDAILNQIPILYASPPSFLLTKDPSPQCANINGGTLLCCNSIINGDMPLVVELAQLTGNFRLNHNSINGLFCKKGFQTCNPGVKLCCQVDAVSNPPIINGVLSLALWCQDAPEPDAQTCGV